MTAPADVTGFWFGTLDADGFSDDAHRTRWFTPDADFDADVRERFGDTLAAALRGELSGWRDTPAGALALVILCDQLSRQIHRGSPAAYDADALALEAARQVVAAGDDLTLGRDERAFLYLPFEHSESRLDQHLSVGLFTALRDATPPGRRHLTGEYLRHAQQHRDIVLTFGRFPHRNQVLGRRSSAEEAAFLKNASSYGQSAPDR